MLPVTLKPTYRTVSMRGLRFLPRAQPRGSIILKALFILILAAAVFGGGAYFAYTLFIQPEQKLKNETAFGTPTPPPDATIPEYERCLALKNNHQWGDARAAYEHFIESYPASTKLDAAKDDLGEVNVANYFGGGSSADNVAYVIKPGDTLSRIERKLKAPGDVIMKLNHITDARKLTVGDTLYVSHPDFSIVVDRKTQLVTLYNHARFFKQYHPIHWGAPVAKGSQPPIAGKVADIASTRNGQRLPAGSPDQDDASHSVLITPGAYSLFTDPSEGGDKVKSGITLGSSDMGELSALLTRGVPVTIQ
jgi:hypothetical protein